MAAPQGPVCNIRLLIVHRYAPGIRKSGAEPCAVEHIGRRGKPVKKMRLIPAVKAFALARCGTTTKRSRPIPPTARPK